MSAIAPPEQPAALIHSMYAAFNTRDVSGFVAHLHPDIVWYTLDLQIQPLFMRGREEVGAFVASLLSTAAVFTAEPQTMRSDGELVLARILHRSRRRHGDPETSYEVVHLWTVRGGQVVKHRFYLGMDKALKGFNGHRARVAVPPALA